MKPTIRNFLASLSVAFGLPAFADDVPAAIERQLPAGYELLAVQESDFNGDGVEDYVVAARSKAEEAARDAGQSAPRRWLLAFVQTPGGGFDLVGKNRFAVFAADEGGQCDPFLDQGTLTAKGRDFTVENTVACGQHWTRTVTFRFDRTQGRFFFYKSIFETLDPLADPPRDSVRRTAARRDKPIPLDAYVP